jgi:class 3 adenylate cyclase
VTFLFTEIKGSTRLWAWGAVPDAMQPALARHDTLLRHAIETNGGQVFKRMDDPFCAAFATAPDAIGLMRRAERANIAAATRYHARGKERSS